ncbi:MAG: hypothetical protein ACK4N5_26435, partial [Myxococcales bacterium]
MAAAPDSRYVPRAMDILSALRILTSFSPPKSMGGPVPWNDVADLAINNGVAPLVSYNLQYRMSASGAPE